MIDCRKEVADSDFSGVSFEETSLVSHANVAATRVTA